ncbi:hypothetical protein OP10G_3955 [Fimbriimonas ginsengisoli Gsoil 348]|uniref:YdhG-like domain-containing protein n=1 Tax=Fimbriimonas ginsengisoli Gsoil 348 TaxID=661478 RepID=A0A068NUV5_FIMGI|nr:hypothetical protein OP10G_3955 [Fimbriimonas ginsengisoli Gsoil 348]
MAPKSGMPPALTSASFFPGHTVADFTEELKGYKTAKGTVQFPHDKPLPEPLVRAMVRARMNENLASG